jgi:hypothetical protein
VLDIYHPPRRGGRARQTGGGIADSKNHRPPDPIYNRGDKEKHETGKSVSSAALNSTVEHTSPWRLSSSPPVEVRVSIHSHELSHGQQQRATHPADAHAHTYTAEKQTSSEKCSTIETSCFPHAQASSLCILTLFRTPSEIHTGWKRSTDALVSASDICTCFQVTAASDPHRAVPCSRIQWHAPASIQH